MKKASHNLLILGGRGRLGRLLAAHYPEARTVDRDELDITDRQAVQRFDWSGIETVINAAAYTDVNGSETANGRSQAWLVNATAVGHLARIASDHKLTLVHFSSDYVFDGTIIPHQEDELLTPLGVYGQTKAAGDIAVGTTPQHYLLRTSWLIAGEPNFVTTMAAQARAGRKPTVVADQIGRLTFAETLIGVLDTLLTSKSPYGTYHVSNSGPAASFAEIARRIFVALGRSEKDVHETTTAAQRAADPACLAPRPLNSTFDLGKINEIGIKPLVWRVALDRYLDEISRPKNR